MDRDVIADKLEHYASRWRDCFNHRCHKKADRLKRGTKTRQKEAARLAYIREQFFYWWFQLPENNYGTWKQRCSGISRTIKNGLSRIR